MPSKRVEGVLVAVLEVEDFVANSALRLQFAVYGTQHLNIGVSKRSSDHSRVDYCLKLNHTTSRTVSFGYFYRYKTFRVHKIFDDYALLYLLAYFYA